MMQTSDPLYWIQDSSSVDSGFQTFFFQGFRVFKARFRISQSRIPDSTSKFFEILNLDYLIWGKLKLITSLFKSFLVTQKTTVHRNCLLNLIDVYLYQMFQSILAWLMLIPDASSFETLINYFSFAAWVFYTATIASLLWLRYKRPEMKRPYKVNQQLPFP